ncbi:TatD family hydrolase [Chitinilyticum piscinae]|uniref:TatD family hydrolase n=1 Tax=Chitinilyticum piscinae TaxID=2866724 RepID=A0A8J7K8R2_9NEIS|nr:TatD family hydrolase [Chitinilyticum piscinae]MBE9609973.1 TatD family hydrolase [Chitinilyticum piscinae]
MPCNDTLIDSHCHLDAPEFAADLAAVIARSREAGVRHWVVPAVTAASFATTQAMALRFGAWPAYGLHPLYIQQHRDDDLALLAHWLAGRDDAPLPVAVGEIGLDGYVPGLDMARQLQFFEAQLKLARDLDLPVIVHIRRSQDLVLKALRKWRVKGGIAHAFNGSRQQADEFLKLGFVLGFGGAMTYSGSQRIRKLASELPLDAIVLETDAPDIPPAWLAGPPPTRNEPAELPRIAAELAQLRQLALPEVIRVTSANVRRVLALP